MDRIINSLDAIAINQPPLGEVFQNLLALILESPYSDYEKQVILKALQDERRLSLIFR